MLHIAVGEQSDRSPQGKEIFVLLLRKGNALTSVLEGWLGFGQVHLFFFFTNLWLLE